MDDSERLWMIYRWFVAKDDFGIPIDDLKMTDGYRWFWDFYRWFCRWLIVIDRWFSDALLMICRRVIVIDDFEMFMDDL